MPIAPRLGGEVHDMADQQTGRHEKELNLEEMFGEAEQTLRTGLQTLTEWGDQARSVMQNRPGVVLASISIAGFMTGILLRQGKLNPRQMSTKKIAADPMIMFLTGAIAGFTVGPRVIREISESYEQKESDFPRSADRPRP